MDGRCPPLPVRLRPAGSHAAAQIADHYRDSDLVVLAKGRVRGLRLVARDGPFTSGAGGPLVSGTTMALVMAMTGRTSYLADLEGYGVELCQAPGFVDGGIAGFQGVGDHRAGPAGRVLGGEICREVLQPVGRIVEFCDEVLGPDEGTVGVTLPAGRAQPQPCVLPHSAALLTGARDGCLACRGREQCPHQPVSSRRDPGRMQRGHGSLAASRSDFRRQVRQRAEDLLRTGCPQAVHTREQVMHLPVSAWRTRCWPHRGETTRASASFCWAVHRQQ